MNERLRKLRRFFPAKDKRLPDDYISCVKLIQRGVREPGIKNKFLMSYKQVICVAHRQAEETSAWFIDSWRTLKTEKKSKPRPAIDSA